LVLPVTGELVGTWGDVANDGLTELVDAAIAGTATVAMTDANYTLTFADGATDEARRMFVVLTGALTATRNVVCPSVSKLYFVANTTTGDQDIVFKTNAGTGITVPNGEAIVLYCDGTNVVNAITYFDTLDIGGALNVGGALDVTGAADVGGALDVTGAADVGGALTVGGDGDFTSTGALKIPVGTTAQRPTPAAGKIRFNDDTDKFEGYDGSAWGQLGGGATGGGADEVFVQNGQTVTTSYAIPVGKNALSTGPITVDSGAVVTIPTGSRWVVL
jgi:hypothetical protein